jgi:hypothetical protein
MKHTLAVISMAPLLAASSITIAGAQPSAAPPPPGGSDDVSQIDGQLVAVGDHHRYRHAYRRYNVSSNALGAIMGIYEASFSYAVHPNLALRIDASYFDPIGGDLSGVRLGAGVPIYFRKAYSGLFLEPGFSAGRLQAEHGDARATIVGPQMLVGYHWSWDSGLNMALAGGLGRNWSDSDDEAFDSELELYPAGYWRFGYAF